MSRRRRSNWPFTLAILTVAGLLLGYAVLWPLAAASGARPRPLVAAPHPVLARLAEQVPIRLFEFFILAWLFVFGSCIGSFLNVVIYRLPRGLSLLGSSFCPRCCVKIRAWDNVPVFGWLKLRGRCRCCHLPISARYPVVEFAVGAAILVLATLEILLAGANLPEVGLRSSAQLDVGWLVGRPRWDLIGACILHSGLVCVLLSWALIRYDGNAVPVRYTAWAFGAGWAMLVLAPLSGAVAWPAGWLDPSLARDSREGLWAMLRGWGACGGLGMLGGLALGAVMATAGSLGSHGRSGKCTARVSATERAESAVAVARTGLAPADMASTDSAPAEEEPTESTRAESAVTEAAVTEAATTETGFEPTTAANQRWDALPGFGLVGLCLGWPAAVSVAMLAAIARLAGALTLGLSSRIRPASVLAYTCLGTLIHLCLWRVLDGWSLWPGRAADLPIFAAAITMVFVLTWQASVLERLVGAT